MLALIEGLQLLLPGVTYPTSRIVRLGVILSLVFFFWEENRSKASSIGAILSSCMFFKPVFGKELVG